MSGKEALGSSQPELTDRARRRHLAQRHDGVMLARVLDVVALCSTERDLWFDCVCKSYLDHCGGEPGSPPIVTVLCLGGDLYGVLSGEDGAGHESSFRRLIDSLGYEYENNDGSTIHFHPTDSDLAVAFEDYFHWQWVCGLITEDTADIYNELYEHFSVHPDRLQRLDWREFETLLFRLFQNQGPAPQLLPHPDDVIITVDGPRFLGPLDGGQQKRLEQRIVLRDLLIMQEALDQRLKTGSSRILEAFGGAILYAMLLEHGIPPRLRLSESELSCRYLRFRSTPKRQLLKDVYRGWARLGAPRPRGSSFPDATLVAGKVWLMSDFIAAATSGDIDIAAVAKGQFDDSLLDFLERHGCPTDEFVQAWNATSQR